MERRSTCQISAKEPFSGELFSDIDAVWRYDYALIRPYWIMRTPDTPEKYLSLFARRRVSFRIEKNELLELKRFVTQIIDMRAAFFDIESRRSILIEIEDGYDVCVSYTSGYVTPIIKNLFK